ncbi:MAG: ABC transporter ATP-binding protein [Bacillota bacterium]
MAGHRQVILRVTDLVVKFGAHAVVDGVNIEIYSGEIRALIGPNGAGKTTLLNAISGIIKPSGGRVVFRGEDITGLPPHLSCRKGIARTFQIPNIMPGLTVQENIWLGINSKSRIPWHPFQEAKKMANVSKDVAVLGELVGLADKLDELAGNLSHGDQKLLEIAMAMSLDGALLLLDEPTQGVSPREIDKFISVIKKLAETKTVLMIEHNMDVVLGISDLVTVLDHGKVIAQNLPAEIVHDERVRQVYLGT